MLQPGNPLGDYQLVEIINEGAYATVWLADNTQIVSQEPAQVALKVLKQVTSPEQVRAEAQILARLEHPHIVRCYRALVAGEHTFIVMEYLRGGDLKKRLQRQKGLSVGEARAFALQLLDALAYAHEQGVLHRDIKPANILFDALDRPKLGDFGIARLLETQTPVTPRGTPSYQAPEGYDPNCPMDHRSDLWSMGVVLYEMLAGSRPFADVGALLQASPPPLPEHVPPGLAAVVFQALAKDPNARFPSAREMLAALQSPDTLPIAATTGEKQAGEKVREPEPEKQAGPAVSADEPTLPIDRGEPTSLMPGHEPTEVFGAWRMWGANAAHTGTVETTVQPPLREVWPRRRRVDAGVRALVADDRWVVAGCETRRGGSVVALNPATGAQRWQFSLADPVTTTPVLLPDGVCVAAGEGVYRLTVQPDGTVRESARGDAGDAVSSPVYAAGGIFAGTGNGFVYALPAKAEGKWRPAWKKKIADEVQASPAVSEGILYVGGMDGRFYALDARTGEELWKVSTDGPVVGAAAVREGWAFVGSTDGSLYAITAGPSARGGGRVAWRYDLEEPLETTPAVWAGKVFVSTGYRQGGDAGLLVLPVGTHEPAAPLAAWRGTAPPETVAETTSPAVGQNGTVGVGTPGDYDDLLTRRVWAEQPRLYVLRWTGTALDLVADYEFTESSLRAPPVFSGDRLYAAAEDGTVACWTPAEAENEARG